MECCLLLTCWAAFFAAFVPCPTRDMALQVASEKERPEISPYVLSLAGTWDFCMTNEAEAASCAWTNAVVPSCWQLQGRFDPPCAFDSKTNAGAGLYRRTFVLPKRWEGRAKTLHFNGVSSSCSVAVNGQPIGAVTDGRAPFAFDVTPFVRDGGATNVVEVLASRGDAGWASGAWRFAGIFRDAWLASEPVDGISNVVVEANLSEDFAHASVRLSYAGGAPFQRLELVDAMGRTLGSVTNAADKIYLEKPYTWSGERPSLYTLVLLAGRTFHSIRVGFRTVSPSGRDLVANGKRMRLKAVDYAPFGPHGGPAVFEDDLLRDVKLLKNHNVNAVRLADDALDPRLLDMCDRHGIWALCSTNVAGAAVLRNHPCALVWQGDETAIAGVFADDAVWSTAANNARQEGRPPFLAHADDFGGPEADAAFEKIVPAGESDVPAREALFDALRNPRPSAAAMKHRFRDVFVDACDFDNFTVSIRNGFAVREMSSFRCQWSYAVNGVVSYRGRFSLRGLEPGGTRLVHLMDTLRPKPPPDRRTGERTLTFAFSDGGVGEVARITCRADAWKWRRRHGMPEVVAWRKTLDEDGLVAFAAADVEVVFNRKTGLVASYKKGGKELFASGLAMDFWRAPAAGERRIDATIRRVWRDAGASARCTGVTVDDGNAFPVVTADYAVPAGASKARFVQALTSDGALRIDWTFVVPADQPAVPRAALTFDAPLACECLAWYGYGPGENGTVSDGGADGTQLAIHNAVVGLSDGFARQTDAFNRPLLRLPAMRLNPDNASVPGEQGHRAGVRWLKIGERKSPAFEIASLGAPFGFNAWPYPRRELEEKRHFWEISRGGAITFAIESERETADEKERTYRLSILVYGVPAGVSNAAGRRRPF